VEEEEEEREEREEGPRIKGSESAFRGVAVSRGMRPVGEECLLLCGLLSPLG
jgi:hypothetical protein